MGCISSKLLPPGPGDRNGGARATMRGRVDHVVSLTSTTYGVLDLHPKHGTAAPAAAACQEKEQPPPQQDKPISREWKRSSSKRPPPLVVPNAKKPPPPPAAAKPESGMEVINAWEIMAGLEDADAAAGSPAKKPAKPSRWSPARVIAMALPSPKKSAAKRRNTPGKENSPLQRCSGNNKPGNIDADRVLRPYNSIDNSKLSRASKRFSPASTRVVRKPGAAETGGGMSSSRRSLSPLFDPELLASIERELSEEGAHIKRMVGSEKPKHPKAAPPAMVAEGKCPPGGADAVVLYTTTLRGIRKTFEECNVVRSAIEAHDVKVIERDVSMDSGYREELRLLLGGREVRVPAVFVRGRHVGGAAEVTKLEEEGKLKALLQGLPRARVWCAGCAGVRFVMCRDCNGSRKVRVDGEQKETVQCGECNENGLVRCPICS